MLLGGKANCACYGMVGPYSTKILGTECQSRGITYVISKSFRTKNNIQQKKESRSWGFLLLSQDTGDIDYEVTGSRNLW